MKAPSPHCLQTLRMLAFPYSRTPTPICIEVHHQGKRNVSSQPARRQPPKPAISKPPAPNPAHNNPQPSPISPSKNSDSDEEFTPQPLSRPIGMPNPPKPGENMGVDRRGIQQRRDEFVDYDKHLQKRARMTKQISKPYFRDWSNLRFHKGKVFVAPERLFRAEHALYFPNFFGRTLEKGVERRDRKDGFRGAGRDTCEVMSGKVSVVSVFSNTWALNQVRTFTGPAQNPGLRQLLESNGDVFREVDVNYEDNVLKYWILRFFGLKKLRNERTAEEQKRYFIVRRGVSDIMKEALGLMNLQVGYVYLVDPELRIRWAGSANAEPHEKESLVRGAKKLIQEAKGIDNKSKLNVAMEELVEQQESKRASAAA